MTIWVENSDFYKKVSEGFNFCKLIDLTAYCIYSQKYQFFMLR